MKLSLEDTAFEVQFSSDPAKTQRLLKKAFKSKMVPSRGIYERFCMRIDHSQPMDSVADPILPEGFNSSWKFLTNYR